VIWELQQQPAGFRELRRRCGGMSSSVLSQRLRELTEAGVVTADRDGIYHLTPLGQQLEGALAPLLGWSQEWERSLRRQMSGSGATRRLAR
jgi:DNA-binding HxlR family transcriptional regulator